jgi:hypothetical protein
LLSSIESIVFVYFVHSIVRSYQYQHVLLLLLLLRIQQVYLQEEETRPRKKKYQYTRLNWPKHVEKLEHNGGFQRTYHMSINAFQRLVGLLQKDIEPDRKQSQCSTSGNVPVSAELVVAAGI